jgi:hypothetical protein
MRIDKFNHKEIEITLSKRNLEALLDKLNWDSARTITFTDENDVHLVVHSEHNETHYSHRTPGTMVTREGTRY